jgi:hypothetical protein
MPDREKHYEQNNSEHQQPSTEEQEPVKNPNPAANANVVERTADVQEKKGKASDINSEITDGEDA